MSALAGLGLSLQVSALLRSCSSAVTASHSPEFRKLCFDLLRDWCDGMLRVQVNDPSDPKVHGMLKCPACEVVHARLLDAVYPFLFMAKATGEQKYLDAGIAAFEWGGNVSGEDGSWTVIPDPKSWKGITVFGAIALAEALKFHGDLLDEERRLRWTERLKRAAEFIFGLFPTIDATNVNYGATNIYALHLIGGILDKPEYIRRSRELAREVKACFTGTDTLLFGEIKPSVHKLSAKGLHGIDLGYNVEESLNGIALFALHEKDEELLELVTRSLSSHLEFMLPDGAWDNSWGTRQFKWTYWGSRTSDGCAPAYGMMAGRNTAFGTAAVKNTGLLKLCTDNGLLHGGPHYVSHGIKPCVHHTFAHTKPLAFLLDHWDHLPPVSASTPLPRDAAEGIRHFKDIDTSLFARGNWRGTVTAYDAEYSHKEDIRQATGGALSVLFHKGVGPLFCASMAKYKMVERNNQQAAPGEDIALTPRVEVYSDGQYYSNLYDLSANFSSRDEKGEINLVANVKLKNEAREVVKGTASDFEISYSCTAERMRISAGAHGKITEKTAVILPVISPSGEQVNQPDAGEITIEKPGGKVRIKASVPLEIRDMPRDRTFNMVPGMEAIPIIASFREGEQKVLIDIQVENYER